MSKSLRNYKGYLAFNLSYEKVNIIADQLECSDGCHRFYLNSQLVLIAPANALVITEAKLYVEEVVQSKKFEGTTSNTINHNLEELK